MPPFGFGKPDVEKMKSKVDIKGLLKALSYENDPAVRRSAAVALGLLALHLVPSLQIGDVSALDGLINALRDSDESVRYAAVVALKNTRSVKAVDGLINALKDSSLSVNLVAVEALGDIADLRAVDALAPLLNYEPLKERAAKALAKIDSPRARELLGKREPSKEDLRVQDQFNAALKRRREEFRASIGKEREKIEAPASAKYQFGNAEIDNWATLLSVLKEIKDPLSATDLFSRYPYQILFVMLKAKIDEPSFFNGIPFAEITQDHVDKARRYIDNPPIPTLLAVFGVGSLPSDRYVIMSGGNIGRKSNVAIDHLIVSVAQCLKGQRYLNDNYAISNAAYDAVIHYQAIPLVSYFFSLPYLESAISTKMLSPNDALISVYKGVEGLLLEVYNELGEGETIDDDRVKRKVLQMLTISK